jgi:integrase
LSDVVIAESHILVNIRETKNYKPRSFAIIGLPNSLVKPYELVMKYLSFRPLDFTPTRFFFQYHKGKALRQLVGLNLIRKIPSNIASFLHLNNLEKYTGHSFRRSSASWLANAGADKDTIMRHGGWRSATVAEGYVETSIGCKKRIAAQIFTFEENAPPEKIIKLNNSENVENITKVSDSKNMSTVNVGMSAGNMPTLNFNSCSNVTVNINLTLK